MKKETKIILIGISTTLLVLALAFITIYLIYNKNLKEEKKNISNQNYSSMIENTSSNIDKDTSNQNYYSTNENISSNDDKDISLPNNSEYEEKQVTVYLFRGKGCHFCENAIEFLKSIINNYPYLEIKTYEVWYNEENKELMNLVSQELNIEIKSSVPLIIIGSEYAKRGFSNNLAKDIKKEIENSYNNSEYQDIVEQILNENPELHVAEEIIK